MNFVDATYSVCRFYPKYDDMCNICVYIVNPSYFLYEGLLGCPTI
jgi:hypothetical protein